MKTLKLIIAVAVLNVALFSCSSDDDNNNSQLSCEDATMATAEAAEAFSTATSENYVARCNAYRQALENQIDACGDSTGVLQALIDGLGDCTESASPSTGTLSMSLGSAPLTFDQITVTTTGTTRHVNGVKSTTDSYEIDFDIEVGATGADKITNFQLRLFSHTYTPMIPAAFGNDWTSNITVNTSSSVVGTFSGELESATAGNIQDLLNGVVNVNF